MFVSPLSLHSPQKLPPFFSLFHPIFPLLILLLLYPIFLLLLLLLLYPIFLPLAHLLFPLKSPLSNSRNLPSIKETR